MPKQTEPPDTMRRPGSVAQGKGDRTLDEEIAQLRGLALNGLRARWQSVTGGRRPLTCPGTFCLQ